MLPYLYYSDSELKIIQSAVQNVKKFCADVNHDILDTIAGKVSAMRFTIGLSLYRDRGSDEKNQYLMILNKLRYELGTNKEKYIVTYNVTDLLAQFSEELAPMCSRYMKHQRIPLFDSKWTKNKKLEIVLWYICGAQLESMPTFINIEDLIQLVELYKEQQHLVLSTKKIQTIFASNRCVNCYTPKLRSKPCAMCGYSVTKEGNLPKKEVPQ